MVYFQYITDIQYYICSSRTWFSSKMYILRILGTTIYECFVTFNNPVTTVYNEIKANNQCSHLLKYRWLISTTVTRKYWRHSCNIYCVWTSIELNILLENKDKNQMLANIGNRMILYKTWNNNDCQQVCYDFGSLLYIHWLWYICKLYPTSNVRFS